MLSDLWVLQLFRPRPRRRGRPGFLARWWRDVTRWLRWGTRHTTPEHKAFMRSPEWRSQRARALRRDGYVCQDCFNARAREVHHEWYARPLVATPDAALTSLCEPCHRRRHHPASGGRGPTSRRLW